jgi:hypothetical protein
VGAVVGGSVGGCVGSVSVGAMVVLCVGAVVVLCGTVVLGGAVVSEGLPKLPNIWRRGANRLPTTAKSTTMTASRIHKMINKKRFAGIGLPPLIVYHILYCYFSIIASTNNHVVLTLQKPYAIINLSIKGG